MSLITKKTRIDAKRVADLIGCSRKTVLNGGAGTSRLTRIRNGSRQVRFILEEVEALVERQMKRAQGDPLTHTGEYQVREQPRSLTI